MFETNISTSSTLRCRPKPSVYQPTAAKLENAMLVQLIKSKNERGFSMLYDNYCGALYNILIKYVRRKDVAEDLLQDVFVKIWKNIESFDPERGTLFTWMLNIARNLAIDFLRSSEYQKQLKLVEMEAVSVHMDHICASSSPGCNTEFENFRTNALRLDAKYAIVIDMIFFNGWTYDQTAKLLNLPIGTVKTRARKGLSVLKIIFQQ